MAWTLALGGMQDVGQNGPENEVNPLIDGGYMCHLRTGGAPATESTRAIPTMRSSSGCAIRGVKHEGNAPRTSDHPFEAFEYFPFHKLTLSSGDVFARAYIRFIEVQQSIKIIKELIENLPEGELNKNIPGLKENSMVISMTEGWRGEISHVILTDKTGKIKRVKVKDPSFNNWFGLALAVRNEGISDFPICNKSFNLSYCGFDL